MNKCNFNYSIIQFSPFPERFEYVNLGVLVFDEVRNKVEHKISNDFTRVKKFFGDVNTSFLGFALQDFCQRVIFEYNRNYFSSHFVDSFNEKRADLFKLTPISAAFGESSTSVVDTLFCNLIALSPQVKRIERVNKLLTDAFSSAGVLQLLQKRPEPVHIEQYGVSIQADYGYQNGVYNLIDAARFDSPQRALAEAGKRVLEGRAISELPGKRLVVVAEFGEQPLQFVDNLRDDFHRAGVKLFRLEEVDQLADEIRRASH